MKRCLWLFILCISLLQMTQSAAEKSVEVNLQSDEWTWEAEQVSTFTGQIVNNGELIQNPILTLSIRTEPEREETGKLFFSSWNGKRLKVKKQKETLKQNEIKANETSTFNGSWVLPEGVSFQNAEIRLTLADENGTVLAETALRMNNEGWLDQGNGQLIHVPVNMNTVLMILVIASGFVWAAAVIRSVLSRRNRA